jgi:adenine deaminase
MKISEYFFFFFLLLFLIHCSPPNNSGKPKATHDATYDYLFVNGTIVDGLGNPSFRADVAVKEGRIVKFLKRDFRGKRPKKSSILKARS